MRAGVMVTFTIICAVIAWMDIQTQTIYNEAIAVLFVPAIVSFFVFPELPILSRILGAVSVSGIMLLVSLISPGAFGGGDIKMMVPVGLYLGLERTLVAGLVALAAEGTLCLWLLLKRVRENFGNGDNAENSFQDVVHKRLSLGPALCLGSVTALLWGEHIWQRIIEF